MAGGFDVSGETVYVGRALVGSDLIPGKIVPSHGVCYVAYGGRENGAREYQALVARSGTELVWVPASGGNVHHGAVQGGMTANGEKLFIGRRQHEGAFVIGKIHPSHGSCYISFGGQEIGFRDYEVLCVRTIGL